MTHILTTQALITCYQSLKQIIFMTSANDIRSNIIKELLNNLCKIAYGKSIHLLDKQNAKVCMLELKHKYTHIGGRPPRVLGKT